MATKELFVEFSSVAALWLGDRFRPRPPWAGEGRQKRREAEKKKRKKGKREDNNIIRQEEKKRRREEEENTIVVVSEWVAVLLGWEENLFTRLVSEWGAVRFPVSLAGT